CAGWLAISCSSWVVMAAPIHSCWPSKRPLRTAPEQSVHVLWSSGLDVLTNTQHIMYTPDNIQRVHLRPACGVAQQANADRRSWPARLKKPERSVDSAAERRRKGARSAAESDGAIGSNRFPPGARRQMFLSRTSFVLLARTVQQFTGRCGAAVYWS